MIADDVNQLNSTIQYYYGTTNAPPTTSTAPPATTTTPPTTSTALPTTTAHSVCNDLTGDTYYEDGYRYEIKTNYLNWDGARHYCLSHGGDLAYHGMDSLTTRE